MHALNIKTILHITPVIRLFVIMYDILLDVVNTLVLILFEVKETSPIWFKFKY